MKKKVIITIGAPASGKSTYAHDYQRATTGVEILERDIIRESLRPGYTYQSRLDNEFEKRDVTEAFYRKLEDFFASTIKDTLIISDTNLNPKHRQKVTQKIEEFAKQYGHQPTIEYKKFDDSKKLDLLIQRNRDRTKQVPEDVIVLFHKKYLANWCLSKPFPQSAGKSLIFIGDIHGQLTLFEKALKHFSDDSQHLILLGDINDPRMPEDQKNQDNFVDLYFLVKDLVDSGKATLIHSNHQKNLIAALRNKRRKATWGLRATLDQIEERGLIQVEYEEKNGVEEIKQVHHSIMSKDMANWLDARPAFFRDADRNVVGVHAQYLPEHCPHEYDVSGRGLEAAIYGTKHREDRRDLDNRIRWWETYQEKPYVVAGHYHELFISDHCAIIDAGCGEGGPLTALDFDNEEVIQFEY